MQRSSAFRSMTPAPELVEIPPEHRNVFTTSGGESGLDRYCRESSDSASSARYCPLKSPEKGAGSLLERDQSLGAGSAAPTRGSRSFVDSVDSPDGSTLSGPRLQPTVWYCPLEACGQGEGSLFERDQAQGAGTAAPTQSFQSSAMNLASPPLSL